MARPRRPSVEGLPPNLYMEQPLWSPDGKQMPVYVLEKEFASSRDSNLDQEWSFWGLAQDECLTTSRMTTISEITSKLASVFSGGGISPRVQHRPVEMAADRDSDSDRDTRKSMAAEKSCEEIALPNSDEEYERILQHLERIEGSVKDLKARVDDAKLRIEQSEQEWGALPCDQAKAMPSLSSPVMEKMASPEEPVMEERELRYSSLEPNEHDVLSFRLWAQEASQAPPKRKQRSRRAVSGASEELDLETALDLVAEEYAKSKDLKLPLPNSGLGLRFRMRNPPRDVNTDTSPSIKLSSDAGLNPKAFDLRSRRAAPKVDVDVEVRPCEDAESQDFNPSPCSFTCELSPTSLFSDDQEPCDENMFLKNLNQLLSGGSRRKSPRSVLSPKDEEPDEISHSEEEEEEEEEKEGCQQTAADFCSYFDESSDLESPMKPWTVVTATDQPFPAFTYNVGDEMGSTSSSEEGQARDDTSVGELEFFREAAREPWFLRDGDGVLNDSDLEFLLSPDLKIKDITSSVLAASNPKTSPFHARDQKPIPCQEVKSESTGDQKTSPRRRPGSWVPYVTGELHGNDGSSPVRSPVGGRSRRHGTVPEASLPCEKTVPQSRPPKRSVNFAADLVKEIPYSPDPTLDKKPAPPARTKPNVNRHDGDECISTSRSAKVEEEEGPSIMTSRRRWRRNRDEGGTNSPSGGSSRGESWDRRSGSRRRRLGQVVFCGGNLCSCSWPERFKVSSRGKGRMESEEESFTGDSSFGMSARRDAEQVRRILKGSHKRYSNLTVDEIMKADFEK